MNLISNRQPLNNRHPTEDRFKLSEPQQALTLNRNRNNSVTSQYRRTHHKISNKMAQPNQKTFTKKQVNIHQTNKSDSMTQYDYKIDK